MYSFSTLIIIFIEVFIEGLIVFSFVAFLNELYCRIVKKMSLSDSKTDLKIIIALSIKH